MELTGKCKEEFEKWYFKDFEYYPEEITDFDRKITLSIFYTEKDSMKYGVLVDYFDSVGVDIEICKYYVSQEYYYMINDGDEENRFKTRPEARTASIEKANELRNEVLNK
tara:strand:+ start:459 stop:788 length:330 start_codon:yes stop_codon:yes gene_type:complete